MYCVSREWILSVLASLSDPCDCHWKWVPSEDRVEELWKGGKEGRGTRKGRDDRCFSAPWHLAYL